MSWSPLALARNVSEDPIPASAPTARRRCRAVEVRIVWKGLTLDVRLIRDSFQVDGHTLLRIVGAHCVIDLDRSMTRLPLVPGAEAQVSHGPLTFVISPTPDPPNLRPDKFGFRWDEQKYLIGSAGAMALMLLMLMSLPRDAGLFTDDVVHRALKILPVVYVPQQPPLVPPTKQKKFLPQPARKPGPLVTGQARGGAHRHSAAANKPMPVDVARVGLLGLLDPMTSPTMAQVLGRETALGEEGLFGLSPGDTDGGPFAGIIQGTGARGGRGGEGLIGKGGLSTVGSESVPHHAGRLAPRLPPRAPPIVTGAVETRGGLDKDIVRRIVRRHINEIRFCYDQALVRKPTLAGRLVTEFTIAPDGRVATSLISTGIGDAAMDGCVTMAIRRWEFPRPGGGGLVMARYPFTFSAP